MTAHEIDNNVKYIGDSIYLSELNETTLMLFLNNGESVAPLEYLCKHDIVLEESEIRVLTKHLNLFLQGLDLKRQSPKRPKSHVHSVNSTQAQQPSQ